MRKLSRPWHGPYRIPNTRGPDVDVTKVYRPQDGGIQVHQSRVKHCPNFPAAFYWYGGKQRRPGQPAKWVDQLLEECTENQPAKSTSEGNQANTNGFDTQGANNTNDSVHTELEHTIGHHIQPLMKPTVTKRWQGHYQLC